MFDRTFQTLVPLLGAVLAMQAAEALQDAGLIREAPQTKSLRIDLEDFNH